MNPAPRPLPLLPHLAFLASVPHISNPHSQKGLAFRTDKISIQVWGPVGDRVDFVNVSIPTNPGQELVCGEVALSVKTQAIAAIAAMAVSVCQPVVS